MSRLFRVALSIVPRTWRESVQEDLEGEAVRTGHGALWCAWQALHVAVRLRGAIGGNVMWDLRYAIRSLLYARSFTVGAVLTFAIGIGLNIAIFSAADRLLFRKLPYTASDELVQLRVCKKPGECYGAFPAPLFLDGRTKLTTIGPMAVAGFTGPFQVQPPSDQPPIRLHETSANLLRVLGVRPVLGRDMTDEDERTKPDVAMLSYETWQRRFGGSDDVLGRRFVNGKRSVAVIGILPKGFVAPTEVAPDPEWDGLVLDPNGWASASSRRGGVLAPIARLRPGASLQRAREEMTGLIAALAPELQRDGVLPRIQVDRLESALFERVLRYAWLIVGASVLILLMACVNLSMLLLVRGRSQQRNTAVRIALGASPRRIVLASLLETLAIALLGAGLALLAFAGSSRVISAVLPPIFGRYMESAGSPRVLSLAILGSVLCAIVAGVWPGVVAARADIRSFLGGAGHRPIGRVRGGRAMLVVESALGVALVVGAAMFVGSLLKLTGEELGFRPEGLFRLRNAAPESAVRGVTGYEEVLTSVAGIPGVVAVGGSDSVVGGGGAAPQALSRDSLIRGGRFQINAGYFNAIGNRLLAGREFTPDEVRHRAPLALLDQGAASLLFPHVAVHAVVGRPLLLQGEAPRTVLGIVTDVRPRYGAVTTPSLYLPLGAEPSRYGDILVRATGGLSARELRSRVNQALGIDKAVVASIAELMDEGARDARFRAILLVLLAFAGLVLAAGGLYALAAFEVALRKQELGVRLALGASAAQIRWLLISEAARPVLLGTAIGLIGAWWASAVFQSLLYRLDARGPEIYGLVAFTLLVTAVAAAWIPARRAARTDPAIVLRTQ